MAIDIEPGIDQHGLHAELFQLVRGGGKRGGMAPLNSFQHAHGTILEPDEIEAAISGWAKNGVGVLQSVARGLKISRRQLTNLDQAQRNLKDFVDASIVFGEVWADCDQAKSKLRDELENPTEDLSSFRYWNDLKELLKHAKTKIDEETASFLRPKSEFVQFNEALDSALQLIETVIPKGAKSKKLETISKAYDHMQNAVMRAQAIVETCQDGAKDKLKDISTVIQSIFEGEQSPAEGASIQRQEVPRGSDRVPVSENRLDRTASQPGR